MLQTAISGDSRMRRALQITALSGALAVALGAFGAHALEGKISEARLDTYHTASLYHFVHTLALLLVCQLPPKPAYRWSQRAFGYGLIIFCGSLYVLATRSLLGIESAGWLGAITPIGGLCFIAGWVLLAAGAGRPASTAL